MAGMIETPSRIWRRIQAVEGHEMPSLPSLPAFETSGDISGSSSALREGHESDEDSELSLPIQSTPSLSTVRAQSRIATSTASAGKFASSIASRSTGVGNTAKYSSVSRSQALSASGMGGQDDSFDVSAIHSVKGNEDDHDIKRSVSSVPDVYLPPDEGDGHPDRSLLEALESVSRSGSPLPGEDDAASKKPSPFDKFRNVALRRRGTPARLQTRTPSLTRTSTTSPSSNSSPSSTPRSTSIALPDPEITAHPLSRSPTTSPALVPLPRSATVSPLVSGRVPPFEDMQLSDDNDYPEPRGEAAYPPLDDSDSEPGMREIDHFTLPAVRSGSSSEANQSSEIIPRQKQSDNSNSVSFSSVSLSSGAGRTSQQPAETPSEDDREPTFSDEASSERSPPSVQVEAVNSPNSVASATPVAVTPTQAISLRPRPRFSIVSTPQFLQQDDGANVEEDPLTPVTRRRSFLLSVINSTARPRPRLAATPHPYGKMGTSFANATPRPVHPLAQTITATDSEESEGELAAGHEDSHVPTALARWSLSPGQAPYDSDDRASFISTASSHDLTAHPRANASFDPLIQAGAGGYGVGKFNATKLNSYLHGLNRRLQEENEVLMDRLRRMEEEREVEGGENEKIQSEPWETGPRRRVSGISNLGDVEEDVSGEGWAEEKRELEERLEALKSELAAQTSAKESMQKSMEELKTALDAEKAERARDKDRWRERMVEVEKGVEEIVTGLEKKLTETERKLSNSQGENALAAERAEKAERILESGRELGGELRRANENVAQITSQLRRAQDQVAELEDEVVRANDVIDQVQKELDQERSAVKDLRQSLQEKDVAARTLQDKLATAEREGRTLGEELRATKAFVSELQEGAEVAMERLDGLTSELADAQQQLGKVQSAREQEQDQLEMLEEEKGRASELAKQMEDALEAAEQKMISDEEQLTRLKGRVFALEHDLAREKENMKRLEREQNSSSPPQISTEAEADIQRLEDELDIANREIARVTALLNKSPARKAIEKAKDAKIELLEREKEDLEQRVRALKSAAAEPISTPSRIINSFGISPIHRQVLNMKLRTPRTPGEPLKDLSWLNNTVSDPTVAPLVAEIHRLQGELDRANESIDDKLDKLEDAGLGVVGLTKKLEDAKAKIIALEAELAGVKRREERRLARLARARCQKCLLKIDVRSLYGIHEGDESSVEISQPSLPTEPATPPTRTSEALRADLHKVNGQLDSLRQQWEKEKSSLLKEKAVLEDVANRLNIKVHSAEQAIQKVEKAHERAKADLQGELDKAKQIIAELEGDLADERSRLRMIQTEQGRAQREKDEVLLQLRRTESDVESVRKHMQSLRKENTDLETELRVNAKAEQKARLLEARIVENVETIDQLRQERSLLTKDYKELQHRFSKISEHANNLQDEQATSQTSHDNRRHQLDLYLLEIDDLRKALSAQTEEAKQAEEDNKLVKAEKNNVAQTIVALEADLRRVRKDAEAFGRDLKQLKAEKDAIEDTQKADLSKAERAKKQTQAQIRLLTEQLDGQKDKVRRAQEELEHHRCAINEETVSAIKVQHNKECKGLIVQIRYLKAKFTRESTFRLDLGYQKQYLLVLMSRYEKNERTILASIAKIGFPVPPPAVRKKGSLKRAALAIVFMVRARRACDLWREQCSAKAAIATALQEVRKRRNTDAS